MYNLWAWSAIRTRIFSRERNPNAIFRSKRRLRHNNDNKFSLQKFFGFGHGQRSTKALELKPNRRLGFFCVQLHLHWKYLDHQATNVKSALTQTRVNFALWLKKISDICLQNTDNWCKLDFFSLTSWQQVSHCTWFVLLLCHTKQPWSWLQPIRCLKLVLGRFLEEVRNSQGNCDESAVWRRAEVVSNQAMSIFTRLLVHGNFYFSFTSDKTSNPNWRASNMIGSHFFGWVGQDTTLW